MVYEINLQAPPLPRSQASPKLQCSKQGLAMTPLVSITYTYLSLQFQGFYKFFTWNQKQKTDIFFMIPQIIALKIADTWDLQKWLKILPLEVLNLSSYRQCSRAYKELYMADECVNCHHLLGTNICQQPLTLSIWIPPDLANPLLGKHLIKVSTVRKIWHMWNAHTPTPEITGFASRSPFSIL